MATRVQQMYHDDAGQAGSEKLTDMVRKTKRHDDNPERVVLEAGKKRAPLATIDNGHSQVRQSMISY